MYFVRMLLAGAAVVSAVNDCNWINNYLRDAGVSTGVKINNHNRCSQCNSYVIQHALRLLYVALLADKTTQFCIRYSAP